MKIEIKQYWYFLYTEIDRTLWTCTRTILTINPFITFHLSHRMPSDLHIIQIKILQAIRIDSR